MNRYDLSNEDIELFSFGIMGSFALVVSIITWCLMEPIDETPLTLEEAKECYLG